jgi:hypothetical protein
MLYEYSAAHTTQERGTFRCANLPLVSLASINSFTELNGPVGFGKRIASCGTTVKLSCRLDLNSFGWYFGQ